MLLSNRKYHLYLAILTAQFISNIVLLQFAFVEYRDKHVLIILFVFSKTWYTCVLFDYFIVRYNILKYLYSIYNPTIYMSSVLYEFLRYV